MTISNQLTLSRFLITPFIALFIFIDVPYHYYIAIGLYIAGCITDLLDGYFARKLNQVSNLGIYLDPMADKIFGYTMVMVLLYLNVFPLWVTIFIFIRDLAVDTFLSYALMHKIFIKATYPGKYKSLFLNLAVITGILAVSVKNGNWFFGLDYANLFNTTYFLLIICFLVGFIGSTSLMQNTYKQITSDFKN